MCEANKSIVKDCLKDNKYYKSLLNLISSDELDEKIVENLEVAQQYLDMAIKTLEAVIRLTEE